MHIINPIFKLSPPLQLQKRVIYIMEIPSRWPDPVDITTSTVLADYKWLPNYRQDVFQTVLEREEGIARVYFAAEVELATATTKTTTRADNNCSSVDEIYNAQKNKKNTSNGSAAGVAHNLHDGSILLSSLDGETDTSRYCKKDHWSLKECDQEQTHWTTIKAVVCLTWKALYIYNTNTTLLRYLPLVDINKVGVICDAWIWLRETPSSTTTTTTMTSVLQRTPSNTSTSSSSLLLSPLNQQQQQKQQRQQDVLFRILPENESPLAVPRVLLGILSATHTTGAQFVGFYRDFSRVQLPPLNNTIHPLHYPALPLLRYRDVWTEVRHPHILIAHLLLRHQLACGRPPPMRYNVQNDPTARWSTAAIKQKRESQQQQQQQQQPKEEEEEQQQLLFSPIHISAQSQSVLYAADGTALISPYFSAFEEGCGVPYLIRKSGSLTSSLSTAVNCPLPKSQALNSLLDANNKTNKKEEEEEKMKNKNNVDDVNNILKMQVEKQDIISLIPSRSPHAVANSATNTNTTNNNTSSSTTDNISTSDVTTPAGPRPLNNHLHLFSISPSPHIPDTTNVYYAKPRSQLQETEEKLISLKPTLVGMKTSNEGRAMNQKQSPIITRTSGRTSAVEWDSSIEHMLMLLNKTQSEPSDPEYTRHIAQDLLSHEITSQQQLQHQREEKPLLNPSHLVVPSDISSNDEKNVPQVNCVPYCESPAAGFIPCPPFRM
ncbi:hypothetical protein LSM04_008064 [Trypanosoma melophagium]|uniref:uncharacterized protein n=1 Tax=Trypanosoma melophagium TaxID=715481 RepID=UPI00351A5882|nr:hypothetical protein LSM04_008064 [Trypanosoma melophagium]